MSDATSGVQYNPDRPRKVVREVLHAIEIKRTLFPKLTPAFLESIKTLGATRGTFLMPAGES